MKTKELIRQLQEADPSGELECCLGNADIHFVDVEPAYWDGCLQVLVRDPAKAPYYDIVGAKYTTKGNKVVIRPLSIRDAVFEDEDLPVEFDVGEGWEERYKEAVQKYREETRRVNQDVEKGFFIEYMVRRFAEQYSEEYSEDEVKNAAIKFYDENLTYKDPLPESFKVPMKDKSGKEYMAWASVCDRRKLQWNRDIAIDFEGSQIVLRKINEN